MYNISSKNYLRKERDMAAGKWQEPDEEFTTAEDLIERAEREAGCRWDDPNNDGALAILFGAASRALGRTNFKARDDFAVGKLILHEMSPEGKRQREAENLMADLLRGGMDPDTLGDLLGRKK
jgi:hypothetical protein